MSPAPIYTLQGEPLLSRARAPKPARHEVFPLMFGFTAGGKGAPTNQRRKPRRCCAGGGSRSGSSSISAPPHGGDNLGYRRMDPDSNGRFTHRTRRCARWVARWGEDGSGTTTHDGSEELRGDRRWDYMSGLNRMCLYVCVCASVCCEQTS